MLSYGLLAASCAGLALWLFWPAGGWRVQRLFNGVQRGGGADHLGQPQAAVVADGATSGGVAPRSAGGSPLAKVAVVWALLALGVGWLVPRWWPLVLSALLLGLTACWLVNNSLRRRQITQGRREIAHACQVLAGQLSIGQIPALALQSAAADTPAFAQVAAAQAIGGDVGAALRRAAQAPGHAGLAELGKAWQLSERIGAPILGLATEVAADLLAVDEAAGALEAELASARLTGRLLAGLPVVGLGLGFTINADPLGFLLHHTLGQCCLVGAVALVCLGFIWTEKIAQPQGEL